MKDLKKHDEKIAALGFGSVYPAYLAKVQKKGRTEAELFEVIEWLTGLDKKKIQTAVKNNPTFKEFFKPLKVNPKSKLITGSICGYRIEDIENPLTKKIRFLDKLVDELAKGKAMEKILRK